ncbi:MAG: EAL domain-containing protein [Burkholderiaceae bacterium]|nr:EAL domain-containing protein [Burkholderiaceae bacterium]
MSASSASTAHGATSGISTPFLDSLTEQEREWLRAHPVIRVFQDPQWAPVEFTDERGNPVGMAKDYATLIEQRLGQNFEYVVNHLSWEEGYTRLQRGEIDMTTSVTETSKRLEFWAFTKPYMNIPVVIATQQHVAYIANMHELDGKRVAVVGGYAVMEWIARDFPQIQLVKVKNSLDGLQRLQQGEVDAFIDNLLIIGYYQTREKSLHLKIAGTTPYVNTQRMAVRKDWAPLAGILQKALDSISEAERDEIHRRWVPIRYEYGFDYTLLWQALAVFAVVLLGFGIWNRKLSQEIRDRKLAQAAQKASEQSLAITLHSIGDAVIATDAAGLITRMNPTAERLTAWPLAQALGQPLTEVFCIINALTRLPVSNPVQLVMERREVVGLANHTVLLARDGREYQIADSAAPIRNEIGAIVGVVLVFSDVTEKYLAQEALRIAATAFESQQGMAITNAQRVILRVNKAFTEITGYSAEDAVGQSPSILKSGHHDANFYTAMAEALDHEGAWAGQIWNRRKSGEVYPEFLSISAVKDAAGVVTHYVEIFTDITESVNAQAKINTLVFYDPLTQLPNRHLLLDRLDQALRVTNRHACKSALLFVDLDNFKTINDTLGHQQGDLLLVQVAQRLRTCVRDGDTVARLGSDEFVVVLEGLSEIDIEAGAQAEAVGNNILAAFERDFVFDQGLCQHSTPSIGITLFGGEVLESSDQPLRRAELAMFQAKAAGRNTLCFFDAKMQAEVSSRAALEADLRDAVQQQQFVLHYQPQMVGFDHVAGVEALVRWQHPQRGMVSPAEFIPLAEETGLILPIGQWVLEAACQQLAAWATQPELAHLTMAVNVSARQLKQPNFVTSVLTTLERTGAKPKLLKLELTESMLVADVEVIIDKMSALKAKGLVFSLDDFGTGYSSLAYLKRLPLSQLKIDQGFVRNIVTDPNDVAIAKMVVALAESMGLAVIAEGVELQAQADFLAHLGCHAYQGYLFSRPVPLSALEAFVRNR